MALKQFIIDFKDLSIDPKLGLKDYAPLYKNGISLKNFLLNRSTNIDIRSGRTPSRFNEQYWNGEHEFLTMANVDTLTFTINEICEDKITDVAIDEDKTLYKTKKDSLIISNAMTLGLSFLVDRSVYINQNVFEVNLDETKINKKFVLWYFNLIIRPLFQNTYTSKYLTKDELGRIKLPNISKAKQDNMVKQIEQIEQRIRSLKKTIVKPSFIINKVFEREFKFDATKFESLKQVKFYETDFISFSNNKDLRQSVKFHRNAGVFVYEQLKLITNKKIKNFLAEPIVLGAGVSPLNYDENGDYYYITMANIKNWKYESEGCKLVSKEYSDKNLNKTVFKNDILIARSGEGTIGKVALIEDENLNGIFADFTMRIRLKNYNPLFAYYYFRTDYFQYLVEINKKGLGNNTNIFPVQIQEFPMIDISPSKQQYIVEVIESELNKQKEIEMQIQSERNKIEKILKSTIEENSFN
ncbi:hypothetical protein [Pseudobacteroides cellulosolvens]|uniref:Restriction modification system DNA specificity domain-containing protein n=1 Tax=Pseudobacteroides cellulosolvens ATCC 35603 = DSM 2933 TaxID=398512 RepID=A0A0L6JY73_9FIRM|nr:hypothetical protein [Pseudobacteroides cellulosolvens]KNY30495.1 restriction modification system DNA specificity domain-containing protein [Pseudobacteroides cellulosolvens ATCC 35603 = DSM 2933]